MKLCQFYAGDEIHLGAGTDQGVVDLTACGLGGSMNSFIVAGALARRAAELIAGDGYFPRLEAEALRFAPICQPEKIVCIGLNYRTHALECGLPIPERPLLFSKFNDSLCAHGDSIPLPASCRHFDYEAELVIVVGAPAWQIRSEEAVDHIFGYTCGNDFSARDAQMMSSQWLAGKAAPGFAPAGPFITTADSFDPTASHSIRCLVNGERVQDGLLTDLIFSPAELVSYASHYFPLHPGDLIFTGTPSGVILGLEPEKQRWLKAGDRMTVLIDGLGRLENTLV